MDKYSIPNLGKAIRMLKYIISADTGVSAASFENALDMPKTTAFRILRTLISEGMVDKRGTRFYAGPGLIEIGLAALRKFELRELAAPILHKLTLQSELTSHLAILAGWHSLIVEVCDNPGPIRVASRSGTLAELNCSATGKIFLAHLLEDKLDQYFDNVKLKARTPNTKVTIEELQDEIKEVKNAGYALDDLEYFPNVRCLAAPVRDFEGHVIAAIGVTGPSNFFTSEKIEEISRYVINGADEISAKAGYKISVI